MKSLIILNTKSVHGSIEIQVQIFLSFSGQMTIHNYDMDFKGGKGNIDGTCSLFSDFISIGQNRFP